MLEPSGAGAPNFTQPKTPNITETPMSAQSTTMNDAPSGQAGPGEAAMQSVANAMRDAAKTATEHAAKVKGAVGEAAPQAARALSRAAYMSAYVVSYGVVYASVFVAQSLPQENPIMHGFRDGATAARDALKRSS